MAAAEKKGRFERVHVVTELPKSNSCAFAAFLPQLSKVNGLEEQKNQRRGRLVCVFGFELSVKTEFIVGGIV